MSEKEQEDIWIQVRKDGVIEVFDENMDFMKEFNTPAEYRTWLAEEGQHYKRHRLTSLELSRDE